MRSIKPGRGPSMMGGVMGIFAALFGVVWTLTALSSGAPGMFGLFGLIFIGIAVAQAVYNFKNATGKNRYSSFDITEHGEEPDPLDIRYGSQEHYTESSPSPHSTASSFCPYCGTPAKEGYVYCNNCGKKLP